MKFLQEMFPNWQLMLVVLLKRFIRAFVGGALGMIIPIIATEPSFVWSSVGEWLQVLAIASIIGGVTGVVMALDKWYRWVE